MRLLNPLPLYHVFLNCESLFVSGQICLLRLVKQSHITCTVGNIQLLISHLCLHSELNDLKKCRLKWKGSGGERVRKKRRLGMHSELKNLNFAAHLNVESH